jgi:hypothetical protein
VFDKKLREEIAALTKQISEQTSTDEANKLQYNNNLVKLLDLMTKMVQGQTIIVQSLKNLIEQSEATVELQSSLLFLYQDLLEILAPEKSKDIIAGVASKLKTTKTN